MISNKNGRDSNLRRADICSPEGPTIKKFNLARNVQSRSKFLISLESLNLDVSISPQQKGRGGRLARKFHSLARKFQSRAKSRNVFEIFGPSGTAKTADTAK